MSIIKNYHDKKWTLQFLNALYNSIDNDLIKWQSNMLTPNQPHGFYFHKDFALYHKVNIL
jgi:hypothetical protein